ncbi:MAG: hypothetical protein LBS57_03270 [Treponema sp.]|nr:hypothetical protein [Treponema sp.]
MKFSDLFSPFQERAIAQNFIINYSISMFLKISGHTDKKPAHGSHYTLDKTQRVKYPIDKFPFFYGDKPKVYPISPFGHKNRVTVVTFYPIGTTFNKGITRRSGYTYKFRRRERPQRKLFYEN